MTEPSFCMKFGGEIPTKMYGGHKWKLCLAYSEKKHALQRKIAIQSLGKMVRVETVKYHGRNIGYRVWWRNP